MDGGYQERKITHNYSKQYYFILPVEQIGNGLQQGIQQELNIGTGNGFASNRRGRSHYLDQYWSGSLTHICNIRGRWLQREITHDEYALIASRSRGCPYGHLNRHLDDPG